eukprot:12180037-Prorocentrum_lima.AAC.1
MAATNNVWSMHTARTHLVCNIMVASRMAERHGYHLWLPSALLSKTGRLGKNGRGNTNRQIGAGGLDPGGDV